MNRSLLILLAGSIALMTLLQESKKPVEALEPAGKAAEFMRTQTASEEPHSLKVPANWTESAASKKSVVELNTQIDSIEKRLRSFQNLSFDEFTPQQLQQFKFLNFERAELIKKKIFLKLGRGRYET